MAKEKILIVDSEQDVLDSLGPRLSREGYRLSFAATGEEALLRLQEDKPDLIVLDPMSPGVEASEFIGRLKNAPATAAICIILLSARSDELDILKGLEYGADDYVTKPFSGRVLLARVRALLRSKVQQTNGEKSAFRIHDLVIHPGRLEVFVKGEPVQLTLSQFQILDHLARKPGWVFTRSEIIDTVRGEDYPVTDRSVDGQIFGLRKKLGPSGKYIETIRGRGYRFKDGI